MVNKQVYKSIGQYLYGDGIGFVELVDCLGSDLSVVNSVRISFDNHKKKVGAGAKE